MLLLILACGSISNTVFDDDSDFVAALPAAAGHEIDLATVKQAAPASALANLSVEAAGSLERVIEAYVMTVSEIIMVSPAERTDEGRRWGPVVDTCGFQSSARMSRDLGVYDWSLSAHMDAASEATLLYGRHFAGESVEAGDGSFVWDHGRYAESCDLDEKSTVTVTYDRREGDRRVWAVRDRAEGVLSLPDRDYAYVVGENEAEFQFRAETTWASTPATAEVRVRWTAVGSGRADAEIAVEDGMDFVMSECWNGDGFLIFGTSTESTGTESTDTESTGTEYGVEADCAYPTFASIDQF